MLLILTNRSLYASRRHMVVLKLTRQLVSTFGQASVLHVPYAPSFVEELPFLELLRGVVPELTRYKPSLGRDDFWYLHSAPEKVPVDFTPRAHASQQQAHPSLEPEPSDALNHFAVHVPLMKSCDWCGVVLSVARLSNTAL